MQPWDRLEDDFVLLAYVQKAFRVNVNCLRLALGNWDVEGNIKLYRYTGFQEITGIKYFPEICEADSDFHGYGR